jgi:DNA-binding HxlR family transcriptional regulator
MRSYDEYCAVAKSLDLVGDRWTLLVVRELAFRGPSRYTDLRNGLPGVASNLLADRLRNLEAAGLVAREEAPPPVATTLFRLTLRGEGLRTVIAELMRWGLPLMVEQKPTDAVRSHWIAGALDQMLSDGRPDEGPIVLELRTGDEPITISMRDGEVTATLGEAEDADAVLEGEPQPILGLLLGLLDRAGAESAGVRIDGDARVLRRLGAAVTASFAGI